MKVERLSVQLSWLLLPTTLSFHLFEHAVAAARNVFSIGKDLSGIYCGVVRVDTTVLQQSKQNVKTV